MKKPLVIGLCGYAQVGKTTTAKALSDLIFSTRPVTIVSFAEPVKHIASESFGWDGKKDERGRKLLQMIGTDVGRAYNPDIWVDKWAVKVTGLTSLGTCVIADDVRFQNEINMIKQMNGYVVRILSTTRGVRLDHPSENIEHLFVDFSVVAEQDPQHVAEYILTEIMKRETQSTG